MYNTFGHTKLKISNLKTAVFASAHIVLRDTLRSQDAPTRARLTRFYTYVGIISSLSPNITSSSKFIFISN